jgi:hypothetical protein
MRLRVDVRLWILLALAVGIAVAVQRREHRAGPPPVAPPDVNEAPAAAAPPTLPSDLGWEVAPRLQRDPFELAPAPRPPRARTAGGAPRVTVSQPERVPRVQILLLDPQRPLALVDNRRVAVGDTIGGYRVVGIDAAGVSLERGGVRTTAHP